METALLSQRLERLRTAPGRNVRPPPARADHAASLAAALGGHVRNGVVVLEESFAVPVDRSALAALPYDIPADARLVCLDLETTGLATAAGTVAFLVGLGWWERERLTVRQLVLPDHADEMALLEAVAEALPPDAWLVTYNGRCFDWPLLITRFRMHRRDQPP